MIVFGDAEHSVLTADRLARWLQRRRTARPLTLFLEAAELAQGVLDVLAREAGRDADGAAQRALLRWLDRLAARVLAPGGALPAPPALDWPQRVTIRVPEGFAHHGLDPIAFARAAAPFGPEARIVGIRTIGLALAAMAAAGAGGRTIASVRPVGHPFDRRIESNGALAARVGAVRGPLLLVDEGPGLSGSSLAAAGRWAEAAGVPRARLVLLCSHDGAPGPRASAEVAAFWRSTRRVAARADETSLTARVEALTGPLSAPLEPIDGGRWRAWRGWGLPAAPTLERRKFLATSATGRWLVKHSGLGGAGRRSRARARALSAAGFAPRILGWCGAHQIEAWREDLPTVSADFVRSRRFRNHLARYLAFRSTLPKPDHDGADDETLIEMTAFNAQTALGAAAGGRAADAIIRLRSTTRAAPIATDNKLQRVEWLASGTEILKTDGSDHCAGHDLIGPQDIAWDIAGAVEELDAPLAPLAEALGADPTRADLLRLAHLAFELGRLTLAADMDATEAEPLRARAAAYAERLDAAARGA